MQRTSVDLPLPERPMTTKTSPGQTSKRDVAHGDRRAGLGAQLVARQSASGVPMILCSAGPKTFQSC